ncbi:uncharacterized protein [Antedon mediterranea]|uniref:uncharacterized protein n=1 Tax=Antedon mediterranea TaxID=105859 RepID=UPI003AF4B38E
MSISITNEYCNIFYNELTQLLSLLMFRFFGIRKRNRSKDYDNLATVTSPDQEQPPSSDATKTEGKNQQGIVGAGPGDRPLEGNKPRPNCVVDLSQLKTETKLLQNELNKNLENERLTQEILQLELETLQCKRNRSHITRQIEAIENNMQDLTKCKKEELISNDDGFSTSNKLESKSQGQITLLIMRHAPNDWKKFRNIQNKSDALNLKNELEEHQLAIEGLRSRVCAKLNRYIVEKDGQITDDITFI